MCGLLLGEIDNQKAERVKEDQGAEPLEEGREELPAHDDPQPPKASLETEGWKSPGGVKFGIIGSNRRRGRSLPRAPAPEVPSQRMGAQQGGPGSDTFIDGFNKGAKPEAPSDSHGHFPPDSDQEPPSVGVLKHKSFHEQEPPVSIRITFRSTPPSLKGQQGASAGRSPEVPDPTPD